MRHKTTFINKSHRHISAGAVLQNDNVAFKVMTVNYCIRSSTTAAAQIISFLCVAVVS